LARRRGSQRRCSRHAGIASLPSLPVATTSSGLMASAPPRPAQHQRRIGRVLRSAAIGGLPPYSWSSGPASEASGKAGEPQVCDNVIIHRSKLVNRWLATHQRLRVLHGARYSPHDNPTERVWAALKAWLANTPTLTIQGRSARFTRSCASGRDADADHRRTTQLTLAARGIRAEPQAGA
jgi:hypothetical protein